MPPRGTTRKRTLVQDAEDLESLPSGKKARVDAPETAAPSTTPRRRGREASTAVAATNPDQITQTPVATGRGSASRFPQGTPRDYEVPDSADELAVAPVTETAATSKTATAKRSTGRKTATAPTPAAKGSTGTKRVSAKKPVEEEQPTEEPPTPTPAHPAPAWPELSTAPPTPSKATPSKTKAKTRSQLLREFRQAGTRGVPNLVELEKKAAEERAGEARRAAEEQRAAAEAQRAQRAVEAQRAAELQATPSRGRKHFADRDSRLGTPLKSILTPQKKPGTPRGPRKNVAFGNDENAAPKEVFFDDLPSKSATKTVKTAKAPTPKTVTEPAVEEVNVEEEEEQVDEEVCSVCKKPDSARGNQILFCDGCDMAVHQKCYDVPRVPRGDWFCRNCLQEGAIAAKANGATPAPTIPAVVEEEVPDIPEFQKHLRLMQRILLDRCTGKRRIPLRGQDEAYEKAFQLVEQTVLAGEGNSMMVIGARGSGKTTLVESIVSELAKDHKEEFHVVRLNGFIHTDDKIALKEIWRQLGKEMEVEDDLVNKTNNYADTLASLLAVLSHPSEILETQQGVTSKSVIFIIDEFDLFATHARQTLLYNLFDIAQARKAPIAVLGLTTRIDVVETLEKRVKSRFSHRYVYLSLAKSIPAFWDICKQGITIEDQDLKDEGINNTQPGFSKFLDWWNEQVANLHKTPSFIDNLEYHFHSTKSVSSFLTTALLPLSSLTPTSPSLLRHFTTLTTNLSPPDSKLHLLSALSDLDLSLLIAAARLDIVAHTDTVNFAMAYDEYTSLMGRQRVQSASSGLLALGGGARVWGRGVAGCSWEKLVDLGLLVPAGLVGRGAGGAGGLEGKMWRVDVALEEIPSYVKLNAVLGRWCREI